MSARVNTPLQYEESRLQRGFPIALLIALAACGGLASSPLDASSHQDASADTTELDQVAPDAPMAVYNTFGDPASWQVGASVPAVVPGPTFGHGQGGAFDGRYVYQLGVDLPGTGHAVLARYDTTQPFDAPTSWDSADIIKTAKIAELYTQLYQGMVWANGFVYLTPKDARTLLVRYDPTKPLGASDAYQTYAVDGTVEMDSRIASGAFDGRFLYFFGGRTTQGTYRYDTTESMTAPMSYEILRPTPTESNFVGGGIFDGRYVYMQASWVGPSQMYNLLRYDTTLLTNDPNFVVTETAHNDTIGTPGGMGFDGKYVYAIVQDALWRHDPALPWGSPLGWLAFQFSQLGKQVNGVPVILNGGGFTFDGRYVYIGTYTNAQEKYLVRYDTMKAYGDAASWEAFDIGTLPSNGQYLGTCGAGLVFDGEYVYCVASRVRFRARNAPFKPSLPSSFY